MSSFDIFFVYLFEGKRQHGESAESSERKPRRAFSDPVRIKDPVFTRTWSSETTAIHNARNNGDCAR